MRIITLVKWNIRFLELASIYVTREGTGLILPFIQTYLVYLCLVIVVSV